MRETRILKQPWTPPPPRLVILLVALICTLNLFDTSSTLILLDVVGTTLEEQNPIMKLALEAGPLAFIAMKMMVMLPGASFLGWSVCRRRSRFGWNALCALTALYGATALYYIGIFIAKPPPFLL